MKQTRGTAVFVCVLFALCVVAAACSIRKFGSRNCPDKAELETFVHQWT